MDNGSHEGLFENFEVPSVRGYYLRFLEEGRLTVFLTDFFVVFFAALFFADLEAFFFTAAFLIGAFLAAFLNRLATFLAAFLITVDSSDTKSTTVSFASTMVAPMPPINSPALR